MHRSPEIPVERPRKSTKKMDYSEVARPAGIERPRKSSKKYEITSLPAKEVKSPFDSLDKKKIAEIGEKKDKLTTKLLDFFYNIPKEDQRDYGKIEGARKKIDTFMETFYDFFRWKINQIELKRDKKLIKETLKNLSQGLDMYEEKFKKRFKSIDTIETDVLQHLESDLGV